MQFVLYYGEDGDPIDTTYMRVFASREAAVEHASLLHRYGYEIYVLASDTGDELDGDQALENARSPCVH